MSTAARSAAGELATRSMHSSSTKVTCSTSCFTASGHPIPTPFQKGPLCDCSLSTMPASDNCRWSSHSA
eukprot:13341579-Heterocapsa_arctica.AAC.1